VAQFIGSPKMNILPCQVTEGAFRMEGGRGGEATGRDGATQLGIRPEAIALGTPGQGHIDGIVDLVEYLGADNFLIVDCGPAGKITVRADGETVVKVGDRVGLEFARPKLHFFDAEGIALA
jgi:multiple sugar transport system ATP-binding protein